jgi:hypothetical protein
MSVKSTCQHTKIACQHAKIACQQAFVFEHACQRKIACQHAIQDLGAVGGAVLETYSL